VDFSISFLMEIGLGCGILAEGDPEPVPIMRSARQMIDEADSDLQVGDLFKNCLLGGWWGHLNLRRTFSICMIASREGILSPSSHRETVAMATPILLATSTCVN